MDFPPAPFVDLAVFFAWAAASAAALGGAAVLAFSLPRRRPVGRMHGRPAAAFVAALGGGTVYAVGYLPVAARFPDSVPSGFWFVTLLVAVPALWAVAAHVRNGVLDEYVTEVPGPGEAVVEYLTGGLAFVAVVPAAIGGTVLSTVFFGLAYSPCLVGFLVGAALAVVAVVAVVADRVLPDHDELRVSVGAP